MAALRLFTGPMYEKYNKVLRSVLDTDSGVSLEANSYSTTIGLIISQSDRTKPQTLNPKPCTPTTHTVPLVSSSLSLIALNLNPELVQLLQYHSTSIGLIISESTRMCSLTRLGVFSYENVSLTRSHHLWHPQAVLLMCC
jgi:hypothetical protein